MKLESYKFSVIKLIFIVTKEDQSIGDAFAKTIKIKIKKPYCMFLNTTAPLSHIKEEKLLCYLFYFHKYC